MSMCHMLTKSSRKINPSHLEFGLCALKPLRSRVIKIFHFGCRVFGAGQPYSALHHDKEFCFDSQESFVTSPNLPQLSDMLNSNILCV